MDLIDTIAVRHQGEERLVMLFVGDMARLPEQEAVDVVIVSAFPDDYSPTATSLIGALDRIGVSVSALAEDKEVDLRQFSSCWLSRAISGADLNFRRILCFEPRYRGRAPEVVGDIFRSIVPLATGNPGISQIAMPVVASGDQGEPPEVMLEMLTDSAVHWLSVGLPLERIKIVLQKTGDTQFLREAFARVKQRHHDAASPPGLQACRFDVFVSYSHKDSETIKDLVSALRSIRPSLRVFLDRLELQAGAAWQQHIFEALDDSRKIICAFSPDYLLSSVCKEEFNIALLRHRESKQGVLLPVYIHTATLPTYMRQLQYEDVREADRKKIARAAERLVMQF